MEVEEKKNEHNAGPYKCKKSFFIMSQMSYKSRFKRPTLGSWKTLEPSESFKSIGREEFRICQLYLFSNY